MSPIASAVASLSSEVERLSAQVGRHVEVETMGVVDRRGHLPLAAPGLRSPNGACRMVRASDGWLAVNLAREEDLDLIPAWLGCAYGVEPWAAISTLAPARSWRRLVETAELLGLPVAGVGEVSEGALEAPMLTFGARREYQGRLHVVDLSALWAGPLCGAILAAAGLAVTKVESASRPDPTRESTPEFFRLLNGMKSELQLDFKDAGGLTRLRETVLSADVLITGARPRALAGLGLSPESVFTANPGLVWVAISGYGWAGEASNRVAFGDDAAAAGGLVRWSPDGAPRFLGDALADPLTGLAAAVGALRGLIAGGGVLVDVALARCAAGAVAA